MFKKSLITMGLLLSATAVQAASQFDFQTEIEPQVVNGKAVNSSWFSDVDQLQLHPGTTQLGFTVGQIVFEDGKRRKFNSRLMIMSFDVQDEQTYQLNYKKFRTIEEANKFNDDPTFELKTEDGKPVEFKLAVLDKNGMQGFRDYEAEITEFNKTTGVVLAGESATAVTVDASKVSLGIKQQFANMSREEQQAFMQWAMQNLK